MGHKLHIDQNEKLVIHVLSVDGFSSNIVSHSTMPVKNNLIIYQEVYQSAVLRYGMWDQIRVDHGKEFYLTLFMQEKLADYRNNTGRQPYIQTKSTQVRLSQINLLMVDAQRDCLQIFCLKLQMLQSAIIRKWGPL
ncbi:Kelch-like protein 36 [Dissostichus eleginoides]|uniref:Kelch-like protein 36 n=1 Tax=Dissostichus eleginoides TaxID=100907 RepID=A0AAD9BXT7_DISEL|nr:Kelch-like protein 36 [Dissostichus eleginoides]